MDSVKSFMVQRLPELLFLTAAASALFSTIVFGFHVDDALRWNFALIVGWSFVLLLILTAASYSPRAVVIGGIAYVLVGAVTIGVASATCGFSPFDEVYGNLGSFLLQGFLVATATHLLTRRRWLCLIYLVLGSFVCVLIQFLYLNGLTIRLAVFLIAAVSLLVRSSQQTSSKVISQGTVSRLSALAVGAGLTLVAAALSLGVWFAVIAPLNPPAMELKLITRYYALEEVHVSGYEQYEHKTDQDKKTDEATDGDRQTNKENSNTEETGESADQSTQGFQLTGFDDPAGAIRYWIEFPYGIFVLLGLALAVALVIGGKKALRARRFAKMRSLDPADQAKAFYLFFQKRFSYLGMVRGAEVTPYCYACENASAYALFEVGAKGGATYVDLALLYCRCVYGAHVPSQDELAVCADLYDVFYKNVCANVGRPKYALKYFFRM